MNLLEIVRKIRDIQVEILKKDKQIEDLQYKNKNIEIQKESFRFGVEKNIYFSDTYRNEKQREIATKDILFSDNDYVALDVNINTNNVFIAICQKEKAELNIELTYQKNLLRVAEIEAMKVKIGV